MDFFYAHIYPVILLAVIVLTGLYSFLIPLVGAIFLEAYFELVKYTAKCITHKEWGNALKSLGVIVIMPCIVIAILILAYLSLQDYRNYLLTTN